MSTPNETSPLRGWDVDTRIFGWELGLAGLVALLLAYSWVFLDLEAPNERSRIYLSASLVEQQSIAIDSSIERWGEVLDRAEHDGHTYTDKAPGSSLLGAGFYGLIRTLGGGASSRFEGLLWLFRTCFMIPIAVAGFLVFRRWLRLLDVSEPAVDLASLGWMLATPAFHYASAFFGHHLVAIQFVTALWLLEAVRQMDEDEATRWNTLSRMIAAGLLLGLAGLTEYQAGPVCAMIALFVVSQPELRRPSRVAAFACGALPFVIVLLAYNWAAFGHPLELSYQHLADSMLAERHSQGFAGMVWLRWTYVHGIMFSLHRGLLPTAPWLAFAPLGLVVLVQRDDATLAALLSSAVGFYLIFASSSVVWYGGGAFGPRFLVPVLGLLAALVALGFDRLEGRLLERATFVGLLWTGLAYNQLVTAFLPCLKPSARNPTMDVVAPMIETGHAGPNLVTMVTGLGGLWPLLPLAILVASVAVFFLMRTGSSSKHGRFALAAASLVPVVLFAGYVAFRGRVWTPSLVDTHVESVTDIWWPHERELYERDDFPL